MSDASHAGRRSASPARNDEWEQPAVEQVFAGVYRIPLPLPGDALRAVNVYALVGADSLALIDSGWALESARRQLESALGELGHELGSVSRFLVTHVHSDHLAQALVLRRLFGSRIALGAGERPKVATLIERSERVPTGVLRCLLAAGAPDLVATLLRSVDDTANRSADIWEAPDEWLDDADQVMAGGCSLTVVETPGHTRGHVVYHERNAGLLFSGDHLLPHITPSVGFEVQPTGTALRDYLASLELVLEMTDCVILPAHGPAGGHTRNRAAELIAHHRHRLDEAYGAVCAGAYTGYAVALALLWTRRLKSFGDLDPFNQMLALNETVAHLDVLVEQGRIHRETAGTLNTYYPS